MAKDNVSNLSNKALGVIILPVGIVGALLLASAHSINAGTVGVVTQFGGVTGTVLSPGLQFTLGLADSTVSKHITDLLAEERIAEIPTPKFGNLRCRYYGIAGA